ncbi:hypothetical protein PENTCL1PPCAC_9466, partial [Pristionchus entomophagus]
QMDNPTYEADFGGADRPLISTAPLNGDDNDGRDVIASSPPPVGQGAEPGRQERREAEEGAEPLSSSSPSFPWRSTMPPHAHHHHDDDERSLEGGMNGSTASIASGGSGHCHDDLVAQQTQRRAERVLWIVTGLSVLFISVEAVGGFIAGSLAIITDAGHLLSDLLSFIISIVAIRTARHPASRRLSFGYHRAEILGALISIIILWVLTTVLVLLAIERIVANKYDVDPNTMLITAGCGVAFNIVMAAVLMFGSGGHGHSHGGLSHGHSHGGEAGHSHEGGAEGTRKNVNVRAAFVHIIGDLVQSVGVLIAALIIKFVPYAEIADPICTFVFSLIVLVTTITVLKDIFYVLMEATPPHIDYASLRADLAQLDNVAAVHDLHVWSLNMEKAALSVHLAVDQPDRACETINAARQMILKRYSVHLVTIQAEQFDKSMNECKNCQPISS